MARSTDYLAYVLEQLGALPGVSSRPMFGGFGLYCDQRFFALISRDVLYFRVDDRSRGDYTARGMAQFSPAMRGRTVSMSYFEVPADVLEDPEACAAWARTAIAAAASAKPARPPVAARSATRKPAKATAKRSR